MREDVLSKICLPECICSGKNFEIALRYENPPNGETNFDLDSFYLSSYCREYWRCVACGHLREKAWIDYHSIYEQIYLTRTYGDADGMRSVYEKIMSYPPENSDNGGRVRCIMSFISEHRPEWFLRKEKPSVLDVGSGICVFLARMKETGWEGTALDVDPRQCRHAEEVVGVRAICGDFLRSSISGCFDLVTFNKVIEHVKDPMAMLDKAISCLSSQGIIYIEVPDGEGAMTDRDPYNREEFFMGHIHVFSAASLVFLVQKIGLSLLKMERLREPSGKYTLRAFSARWNSK